MVSYQRLNSKGVKSMDIYAKKEYFVRTSLKELLLSIDSSILDVYYCVSYQDEYVVILNKSGSKIEIYVTGDSLLAIAKNVLENI